MDLKLRVVVVAALMAVGMATAHAEAVRPEVGKPLQQAGELLKAGKAKEALAKVREADGAAAKTPAEQAMIERMRGAAAQRAGDTATALHAFEALFSKASGADAEQAAEQIAFTHAQAKEWAKAGEWAHKAESLGGSSPQLKQLLSYVQAQSGDYGAIGRDAAAAVAAAEKEGRRPEENDLLRLADAQAHTGNAAGQAATLEKLVLSYPKKEYWASYLSRLPRKSGFSDRFSLDVMRLKLVTGNLTSADEYLEMAQLAIQAGYPAEGLAVVEKGFSSGVLGTGAEGDRHKRLRDLAVKQAAEAKTSVEQRTRDAESAKDGNGLVRLGYGLVTQGDIDKGIGLIEKGIAKGQLKHPEDAQLLLGMACLQDGAARKSKAVQQLRAVKGSDGAAELARLWAILGQQGTVHGSSRKGGAPMG